MYNSLTYMLVPVVWVDAVVYEGGYRSLTHTPLVPRVGVTQTSTWTRLIVCVELRQISCEPHDNCDNNRRRFWSSGMTPALQECLGRGLLTDPRGDSAEKQLGSRLDVREFNHGPVW